MPTIKRLKKRSTKLIAKRDTFYNGRPWRRLRSIKLSEEPRCEVSLSLGVTERGTIVDHRLSRRFWPHLEYEKDNLITMNDHYHQKKRAIERTITNREQYITIFGQRGEGVLSVVATY